MTKELDRRRHAYRPDIADIALKGRVDSKHFVAPVLMQIASPLVTVHRAPERSSTQVTQGLMGEEVHVFASEGGFSFCQLMRDSYVGYIEASFLTAEIERPTHRISVPSTFLYPRPDLKSQPVKVLTMNARFAASGLEGKYLALARGGYVFAAHATPITVKEDDFVDVARRFLNAPYGWGGKSVHGIDCSGLVQISLEACGIAAPRDSDMQEEELGRHLRINDLDGLQRGDLVFWDGHVGVMTSPSTLLHANGHHMMTVEEPLRDAVARIASGGLPVTSLKRL
jgi:cell wall-associated NlpC family hydrolase